MSVHTGGGGQPEGGSAGGGVSQRGVSARGGVSQGGSGPGGGSGPAGGEGGQVLGGVRSSWGGGSGPGGEVQHLAPSCGRYASCVHAGGLSCLRRRNTVYNWIWCKKFGQVAYLYFFGIFNHRTVTDAGFHRWGGDTDYN